jgi:hypothetical protein
MWGECECGMCSKPLVFCFVGSNQRRGPCANAKPTGATHDFWFASNAAGRIRGNEPRTVCVACYGPQLELFVMHPVYCTVLQQQGTK